MSFPTYASYRDSDVNWLGQVPCHWDVVPARRAFRQVREAARDDDQQLSATQQYGVIPQARFIELQDQRVTLALGGTGLFKHVAAGDFVISLRSFQGGIEHSTYDGCVSPAYTVLRASRSGNPRYWTYALKCAPFVAALQSVTDGIRDGKTVSFEQFAKLGLPIPPTSEQIRIATFLDRETAKIDELVDEQQRLITLLKEKRQSVIASAVTKGLNPSVPMKHSDIEWIGQIPTHWDIVPLSRIARKGTSITYGIIQAGPDIEGGVPYIRTSDMSGDHLPREGYLRTSPEIDAGYSRSKVKAGDLVIAIRATIGKPLLVPDYLEGANLTQGTARFCPGEQCDAEYVRYFLLGPAASEFARVAKGATFKEITLEMLRKTRVALPPLSEQKHIVDHLNVALNAFDALIANANEAISLLQERRSALVSAAVTGKIDVNGKTSEERSERIRDAACAEIIRLSAAKQTFGRVKFQKLAYLAEVHIGIAQMGGSYAREAAGPLDRDLMQTVEQGLSVQGIADIQQLGGAGSQVAYKFVGDAKAVSTEAAKLLGDKCAPLRNLIKLFSDLDTKATEAVATLYAVWNDELIDGCTSTDDQIIAGVLNDWHPEKPKKFTADDLAQRLGWMRRNGIVPIGTGPKTYSPRLFA